MHAAKLNILRLSWVIHITRLFTVSKGRFCVKSLIRTIFIFMLIGCAGIVSAQDETPEAT